LGDEGHGETKAANLHIQQPVKPIDDITRYGFYRASICLNPGQTALIYNSKYHEKIIFAIEDQDRHQGIAYSIVLRDRETQIIKN
jgi:hypothetical protein